MIYGIQMSATMVGEHMRDCVLIRVEADSPEEAARIGETRIAQMRQEGNLIHKVLPPHELRPTGPNGQMEAVKPY